MHIADNIWTGKITPGCSPKLKKLMPIYSSKRKMHKAFKIVSHIKDQGMFKLKFCPQLRIINSYLHNEDF